MPRRPKKDVVNLAVRLPKGYPVDAPGALVQVDTLQLKLQSNDIRYQFSAHRTNILRKMSLTNNSELIHYAVKNGLVY